MIRAITSFKQNYTDVNFANRNKAGRRIIQGASELGQSAVDNGKKSSKYFGFDKVTRTPQQIESAKHLERSDRLGLNGDGGLFRV